MPAAGAGGKADEGDDVHQNGLASVGPFDAVMISAQNMEPWLRVHITPAIISVLPMWVTANLITLADFGVCVLFTVAAAYSNIVPAWQGFALKILVAVLFVVFALMDVLDGDVARTRNQVSPFGGAWDHFIDSMAVPLTVTASCLVTRTPSYLVICDIILIVMTYNMQAAHHNIKGHWIEPQPGGCAASVLSAAYTVLCAVLILSADFGVFAHSTIDTVLLYTAWGASITLVPTCLTMVKSVGYGRAIFAGGCSLLALVSMATVVTYDQYMGTQAFAPDGLLTLVQYLLLSSAVSVRVSGSFIMHTHEKLKFSGVDVRAVVWAAIIVAVRMCHVYGLPIFAGKNASWAPTAVAWLPYVAVADMLVRSFMDLRKFYLRVMSPKAGRTE